VTRPELIYYFMEATDRDRELAARVRKETRLALDKPLRTQDESLVLAGILAERAEMLKRIDSEVVKWEVNDDVCQFASELRDSITQRTAGI
jgi:hypothetical protein